MGSDCSCVAQKCDERNSEEFIEIRPGTSAPFNHDILVTILEYASRNDRLRLRAVSMGWCSAAAAVHDCESVSISKADNPYAAWKQHRRRVLGDPIRSSGFVAVFNNGKRSTSTGVERRVSDIAFYRVACVKSEFTATVMFDADELRLIGIDGGHMSCDIIINEEKLRLPQDQRDLVTWVFKKGENNIKVKFASHWHTSQLIINFNVLPLLSITRISRQFSGRGGEFQVTMPTLRSRLGVDSNTQLRIACVYRCASSDNNRVPVVLSPLRRRNCVVVLLSYHSIMWELSKAVSARGVIYGAYYPSSAVLGANDTPQFHCEGWELLGLPDMPRDAKLLSEVAASIFGMECAAACVRHDSQGSLFL